MESPPGTAELFDHAPVGLWAAGPDGIFGTSDDLINPGNDNTYGTADDFTDQTWAVPNCTR